jgi:hypothetical protein
MSVMRTNHRFDAQAENMGEIVRETEAKLKQL